MPKKKSPIMTEDEERFMAFSGVVQWAQSILDQKKTLILLYEVPIDYSISLSGTPPRVLTHYRVQNAATLFCTSLVIFWDHLQWADKLNVPFVADLGPIRGLDWSLIKEVRDMREHVADYFSGNGRIPDRWFVETKDFKSDASGIAMTYIGGRVDYKVIGEMFEKVMPALVAQDLPKPTLP